MNIKIKAARSALGAVNEPLPSPKWCLPSHETTWGSAGNATVFYCRTGQHPRILDWMGLDLGSNERTFKNVTYNMHVQMYTKDDWWSKVSNVAFVTLFHLMLLYEVKMSSSIYNMNTYSIFYWHLSAWPVQSNRITIYYKNLWCCGKWAAHKWTCMGFAWMRSKRCFLLLHVACLPFLSLFRTNEEELNQPINFVAAQVEITEVCMSAPLWPTDTYNPHVYVGLFAWLANINICCVSGNTRWIQAQHLLGLGRFTVFLDWSGVQA